MSDEEDWDSDDPRRQKKEDPLPPYTVRFTDMSDVMVHKAVRLVSKILSAKKFDKDAATEIHEAIKVDPDLGDECAGWHVIVGKSFASAITYQTDNVLFFDIPGEVYKTILMFKT